MADGFQKYRILVTGSSGTIGRIATQALRQRGHFVRGMDLVSTAQTSHAPDEFHQGTIADEAAVNAAMESMDTLVHLAATVNEADFISELLPNNILGVYHVMETARRNKVRRVVLASSIQVHSSVEPAELPLKLSDGTGPWNNYGVTKVFAEAMGQRYANRFNMSVIAARIAWLPRSEKEAREMGTHWRGREHFLSHDDAARFYVKAAEAPDIKFAPLWVVSRNPAAVSSFDLEPVRRAIGYEPQNTWPHGLPWKIDAT